MKANFSRVWRLSVLAIVIFLIVPIKFATGKNVVTANNKVNAFKNNFKSNSSCPKDLTKLIPSMLKDLPEYSNRVIQRTQNRNINAEKRSYIVAASQADLETLNLPRIPYSSADHEEPEQVFFTVAEKQYNNNKITTIQTYHWLFLTPSDDGWRMVMMFSRFGNSQSSVPAPPRETTEGIIGQGVEIWLRDCRARTIKN